MFGDSGDLGPRLDVQPGLEQDPEADVSTSVERKWKSMLSTCLRAQDDVPDLEDGEEPEANASGADNSEAALALLRALSRADADVRAKTKDSRAKPAARCAIM